MTARDDDALSWGDDDPTLDTGAEPRRLARDASLSEEPEPDAAAAPLLEAQPSAEDEGEGEEPPTLGNVALVALGLIAGAYIFFAVGWAIAGARLQGLSGVLVDPVMYAAGRWASTLAPVVWFVTVFALTRRSRTWVRFAWLVAGIVLLVPWPFLLTGAIA